MWTHLLQATVTVDDEVSLDTQWSPSQGLLLEQMRGKHTLSTKVAIVSWLIPLKRHVHLEPQGMTLFEIRVSKDIIKNGNSRWDHPGLEWVLNLITSILIKDRKGEDTNIQKGRWCNNEDRLKLSSTTKGMPRIAGSHQRPEQRHGTYSPPQGATRTLHKEPVLPTPWFQTSGSTVLGE